jgi:hypothetical protein
VRRYLKPFRLPGTSPSRPGPHQREAAPGAPAVPKPRKISKTLRKRTRSQFGDGSPIISADQVSLLGVEIRADELVLRSRTGR